MTTTIEVGGRTVALGRHLDAAARHDARSLAWPAETARQLVTVQHEHRDALDQGEVGACTGYAAAGALLLEATGETVGGHEVCLTGIDVETETVTLLNSWGPAWGDQGTARMRWSTLGGLLRRGGDATVLLP